MHGCIFRCSSPRRHQVVQGGAGGGVTVVSHRDGGDSGAVRIKIVVSEGELERIAAGIMWRQCGATARRRRQHVAESLERQLTRAPPLRRWLRSEPDGGAGGAVGPGEWRPALDGIPEEV
ncbi:hypothetical protein ACP4OV_002883 [Aristida adscensionis]